jgi:hypothetical protein
MRTGSASAAPGLRTLKKKGIRERSTFFSTMNRVSMRQWPLAVGTMYTFIVALREGKEYLQQQQQQHGRNRTQGALKSSAMRPIRIKTAGTWTEEQMLVSAFGPMTC